MPTERPTILTWNLEWASPRSRRISAIHGILEDIAPDVMCLTEVNLEALPSGWHVISSAENYGYPHNGQRRKVALLSRQPWSDIDPIGDPSMPPGRFIAGTTAGWRIIGVCIPWRAAHVANGNKNRATWEDHLHYIRGLQDHLEHTRSLRQPFVVLGDFNQRIPRRRQPKRVYEPLMSCLDKLDIITADIVDNNGLQLIDHIALGTGVTGQLGGIIPGSFDGVRLSDHSGVYGVIQTQTR